MKKAVCIILCMTAFMIGQSHNATATVYKDGIAQIEQPVSWPISEGFNSVSYHNFPSMIHKDTPFLSLNTGIIYSQRFDENTFSFGHYYTEKQGSPIVVKVHDEKEVEGILLKHMGESIAVQTREGFRSFTLDHLDYFGFEDQLENLQFEPALVWNIYVSGESTARGHLHYTTGGFDWNASYRLVLNEDTNEAELVSQALVGNMSDEDFSGLQLKLIEGNLQTARRSRAASYRSSTAITVVESSPTPTHDNLGDFHIYTIEGKHRIKPNQTVQLKLYDNRFISYNRTYVFENSERSKKDEPLGIVLDFVNNEENSLGIPLPQGKVDMYYKDDTGSMIYAGTDRISQVPRSETATLNAGRAFDVIGKRKVLNYDRQRKGEEGTIEIELFNGKEDTIQVKVIEHLSGDWVIRNETSMYIKDDATSIHFPLKMNPQERKTITYSYRKEFK